MTQVYLVFVTPGPDTRFDQEPEFFAGELQAFAEQLVKFHSRGTIPAVKLKIASGLKATLKAALATEDKGI